MERGKLSGDGIGSAEFPSKPDLANAQRVKSDVRKKWNGGEVLYGESWHTMDPSLPRIAHRDDGGNRGRRKYVHMYIAGEWAGINDLVRI